jgi:hypothetical protein
VLCAKNISVSNRRPYYDISTNDKITLYVVYEVNLVTLILAVEPVESPPGMPFFPLSAHSLSYVYSLGHSRYFSLPFSS